MTRNEILIGSLFCLLILMLASAGCSNESSKSSNSTAMSRATVAESADKANGGASTNKSAAQKISLEQTETNQSAGERKIIRNATLTLETDVPEDAARKIVSIAETKGGFVVSSDTQQRASANSTKTDVNLVVRVPAAEFDAALGEIRQTVSRVVLEKVAGQDVTEEFIDLDAGLRTKKALEAQFLEILKQAKSVEDALKVQTEIAGVRGEIEKLEGRRKFLENQTSLSTVTITIRSPEVFAASSAGFFSDLGRAFSDGINSALWVILGLIRVFLALLPIIILLGVPLWLLFRYLKNKIRRQKLAQQIAKEESTASAA